MLSNLIVVNISQHIRVPHLKGLSKLKHKEKREQEKQVQQQEQQNCKKNQSRASKR